MPLSLGQFLDILSSLRACIHFDAATDRSRLPLSAFLSFLIGASQCMARYPLPAAQYLVSWMLDTADYIEAVLSITGRPAEWTGLAEGSLWVASLLFPCFYVATAATAGLAGTFLATVCIEAQMPAVQLVGLAGLNAACASRFQATIIETTIPALLQPGTSAVAIARARPALASFALAVADGIAPSPHDRLGQTLVALVDALVTSGPGPREVAAFTAAIDAVLARRLADHMRRLRSLIS